MSAKFTGRILAIVGWLLVTMFSVNSIYAQQAGEKVIKGKYFLLKSEPPQYPVTGVDLAVLARVHLAGMQKADSGLAGGKWGCYRTFYSKADKKLLRISAAVYSTPAIADDSVLALLNDISVILKPGSRNEKDIGSHSWYFASSHQSGMIIFIYGNALFQLNSNDFDLAEKTAMLIAEDLKYGRNGVRLGAKVFTPKVLKVTIHKGKSSKQADILRIEGKGEENEELSYFAIAKRGQIFQSPAKGEKIYIPAKTGSDKVTIYAVNNMCVVSPEFHMAVDVNKRK